MSATKPPHIDPRTTAIVAEQTRQLMAGYLGWPASADGGDAGRALVGVFASYCGHVIERINAAAEQKKLNFLDRLGNSLIPPRAAEAPLSFSIDQAAPHGVAVPAGTRVQAAAPEGASEPILFETVNDLWLSQLQLKAMDKTAAGTATLRDLSNRILIAANTALPSALKHNRITSGEALFDVSETLYFGFGLPKDKEREADRPLSLYFFIGPQLYDPADAAPAIEQARPTVVWQYLSGTPESPRWKGLRVEDGTRDLTESGALTLLLPADCSRLQRHRFEQGMYWIRAYLWSPENSPATGDANNLSANVSNATYAPAPKLQGVALNTVLARQGMTLRDEVLGSSNGDSGQIFTSFRRPILEGQQLEVRESGNQGTAGISETGWVPWIEVADFHGSTHQDRHYLIDRQSGEIRFGDGQAGMIPPPGSRNVRLVTYRTGGGVGGNLPAGSIKTLVSPVRYVDKVTQFVPAAGGAAAETIASLTERAPRALRHRGHAVTVEDYEDLARLASTDVARALCVPLVDLTRDPAREVLYGINDDPGKVSIVVLPRTTVAKPLPSQTLLRQVESFLYEHAAVNASIFVVGPLYIQVNVTVHAALESLSLENRVRLQVQEALADFLHPLSGRDGAGWPFGRLPQESDLHRLLRRIPGINHIRRLTIDLAVEQVPAGSQSPIEASEVESIGRTGRFLVHSGQHELKPYSVAT